MKEIIDWLTPIADELIPAEAGMPSGSTTLPGLPEVLRVRPDLERRLRRAHAVAADTPPAETMDLLAELDPEAGQALAEAVAGGYYADPGVRALLGYTGQQPAQVRPDGYPEYVAEGLLERVVERGPIYRRTT